MPSKKSVMLAAAKMMRAAIRSCPAGVFQNTTTKTGISTRRSMVSTLGTFQTLVKSLRIRSFKTIQPLSKKYSKHISIPQEGAKTLFSRRK